MKSVPNSLPSRFSTKCGEAWRPNITHAYRKASDAYWGNTTKGDIRKDKDKDVRCCTRRKPRGGLGVRAAIRFRMQQRFSGNRNPSRNPTKKERRDILNLVAARETPVNERQRRNGERACGMDGSPENPYRTGPNLTVIGRRMGAAHRPLDKNGGITRYNFNAQSV